MSPPKVSLSGKELLKADSDELPEKGDGAEFPSVIIIETEHRARNFRQQMKRRRCKRIICGVTLVITVAVAVLLTLTIVNVLRRHHRNAMFCIPSIKPQTTISTVLIKHGDWDEITDVRSWGAMPCSESQFPLLHHMAINDPITQVVKPHQNKNKGINIGKSWKCKPHKGLPTNVRVDHENQLIRASHDHDDQSQTTAFEILHEYTRHLIAYKDVDNNTCYIDRLDETFQEGYRRWESYETGNKESQALKVISKPIETEVLMHIGDTNIYGHCGNSKSVWVKEIDVTEVTFEMKVIYV